MMHWETTFYVNFLKYFVLTIPLVVVGIFAFIKTTPYDDFAIIRAGGEEGETKQRAAIAVALDLAGKIIALALALGAALKYSAGLLDYLQWGIIAIVAVVVVFLLFRWLMPVKVVSGIKNGNIAVGIMSAAFSIASGLLLSGLVSY